jgi:hypothetical protein
MQSEDGKGLREERCRPWQGKTKHPNSQIRNINPTRTQSLSVDLPPELARAANEAVAQGSSVLGAFGGFCPVCVCWSLNMPSVVPLCVCE